MTERDHTPSAIIERGQTALQVHPLQMVQMALEAGNVDTAALEKLMDLAERHEANEARKAYATAMVNLKRDLPSVLQRDKTVNFNSSAGGRVHYSHTSLGAAVDAILDPLTSHGFSHSWHPSNDERSVKVTCRLTHSQGHYEETTLSAPPDKGGKKSDAQAIASTTTLLQRYTLLSLLGIATADMKDPVHQEKEPSNIDSKANMNAMKTAMDLGHKRETIEGHVGKPMNQWTAEDLSVLRMWLMNDILGRLDKCKTPADVRDVGSQLKLLNLRGADHERASAMYKAKIAEFDPQPMREPGEEG